MIAEDVANTRVTFRGTTIGLSDGAVGDKLGAIFAVKNYPAKTDSLMLYELNLPVDMVVTHSFVPINANIMAGRIKRQLRLMQAARQPRSGLGTRPGRSGIETPDLRRASHDRGGLGALTTGEAIGRGTVQAPAAVKSAAATASAQVVRMAKRAKRLGR